MGIKLNDREWTKKPTQYPGYYEFQKLELKSTFGKTEDLIPFTVELNLYEDLNSPTLTGSITLLDTTNLIRNLPIIGEETLEVWISDENKETKNLFRVYKISDRSQPNYGTLTYTLHFCSEELYINSFQRVSKAYQKTHFEDAVSDILRTYLKSEKNLLSGNTKYPQSFILPNWSPLFGVNWMASRSQDPSYLGGNFIFFEDMDGFKFVAVENLLDQSLNKPFTTVSLDPMRPTMNQQIAYDSRQEHDVMRFESMEIIKSLDVLENMTFGMYKNMTRIIDISTRGTSTKTYDYYHDFTDSVHLKGIGGNTHPLASSRNLNVNHDIQMENYVFVKSKGLFSDEPDGGFQVEDWFSPRLSQMHQMNNFVLRGTLPGQLEMKVGMIVDFWMPNPENLDAGGYLTYDENYSGQYLITSIRRMFQKNKFFLIVEMIKDSLSTDLDIRGR